MEKLPNVIILLVAHPVLTLLAVAVLYYTGTTVNAYHRLKHIPGPPFAHFSQLWLANATRKGSLYIHLQKVLDEYGFLVTTP